jgi:hypothetical protein
MKYLLLILYIFLISCGGDTDYHFDAHGLDGKDYHFIIHSRNSMLRPILKEGGCIGEYDSEDVYMCGIRDFTYYTTKP